jgi:tetrahedral aminopeptidase
LKNKEFLEKLISTPSPSGMESKIQQLIWEEVKDIADELSIDSHGNLIATMNPGIRTPMDLSNTKIMLAAHCDQIGMIVTFIDAQGYIYFESVGGWDPQQLVGQAVEVFGKKGMVDGVIGKKPIHLMDTAERGKASKITNLWIDIGANNKKEASKKVKIGDYITIERAFNNLLNDKFIGAALDDKAGIWAIVEAFKRIDKTKLKNTIYMVSTVQEEVGTRGAITATYGIEPDIGIAVDVTFATDCPSHNPKEQGDVKLGKGPVIQVGPNITPFVGKKLIKTAKKNKIPHQITASGRMTGTDARSIQISKSGVATGLISIPNRYMHSPVEMISLKDIDGIAEILSNFCMKTFK